MNDGDLLASWLNQLAAPYPDIRLIASLEAQALARGWDPQRALQALTAADFTPDLHPRGKDGKFIEKFGLIELVGKFRTSTGKEIDASGRRGRVESIAPDPHTPGRPNIRVNLLDKHGKPVGGLTVKPDQIIQAPEKARLDSPLNPHDASRRPDGAKDLWQKPDQKPQSPLGPKHDQNWFDGSTRPGGPNDPNKPPVFGRDQGAANDAKAKRDWEAMQARNPSKPPAPVYGPPDPHAEERKLAMDEAKAATDAELARQAEVNAPQIWKDAIKAEQANRAKHRAAQQAPRDKLIADVNAQSATLSTTDPAERAAGLDAILAKLRFSIIDTDKLYGNDYPPGQGKWTAERQAQHEAMYAEVLANVKAAGIPQDRDAFVLGGLPGAGKSYSLRPGGKAESFGVHAWEMNDPVPAPGTATHVSINPDTIKEMMVARGMTPPGISEDLKPMEQVTFIHGESAYLSKMFQNRLSDEGYNVVIDRTFESSGGMSPVLGALADDGYHFRGLFVDIPIDESKQSTQQRYLADALTPQGGRFVPSSVQGNRASVQGNLSKNRDAFDSYTADGWFDEWMVVDNTGITSGNPRGEIVDHGTSDGHGTAAYHPKPTPGSPAHDRQQAQALSDAELVDRIAQGDTGTETLREYNRRFPPPPTAKPPSGPPGNATELAAQLSDKYKADVTIKQRPDGSWQLATVRIPSSGRGQGTGSKVMSDITAEADRRGVPITLTPGDVEGRKMSRKDKKRLRDFYSSFGFVPNQGPVAVPGSHDEMVRPPQPVTPGVPDVPVLPAAPAAPAVPVASPP